MLGWLLLISPLELSGQETSGFGSILQGLLRTRSAVGHEKSTALENDKCNIHRLLLVKLLHLHFQVKWNVMSMFWKTLALKRKQGSGYSETRVRINNAYMMSNVFCD